MAFRRLKATALMVLLVGFGGCRPIPEKIEIEVAGETFRVEVARTDEERARGLMNRKELGKRDGMLFVFESDRRLSFWMKETTIPLSIAFLSSRGEILEIVRMKPLSLKPVISGRSARYALEVLQGSFEEVDAEVGDFITFPQGFR